MTQLVTFRLGGALYGVDVTQVQEVLHQQQRTRVPLAPRTVAGLVNLRGQVVLAVDLRARLALPDRAEGDDPMMVVVRVGGETVSLLVDHVGEVVTVGSARTSSTTTCCWCSTSTRRSPPDDAGTASWTAVRSTPLGASRASRSGRWVGRVTRMSTSP
jgi:purine-binding chemotaxis protein CheW